MDMFDYLTTHVFSIKSTTPGGISDVTPTYEDYERYFGTDYPKKDEGELARLYPDLFAAQIVNKFYPNLATDYGRYLMAISLLRRHLHHYIAEKHEFYAGQGYSDAKEAGKKYVILENIS